MVEESFEATCMSIGEPDLKIIKTLDFGKICPHLKKTKIKILKLKVWQYL